MSPTPSRSLKVSLSVLPAFSLGIKTQAALCRLWPERARRSKAWLAAAGAGAGAAGWSVCRSTALLKDDDGRGAASREWAPGASAPE